MSTSKIPAVRPLIQARRDRNLTQRQAAEAVGIGLNTFKRAERGEPVSLETCLRLTRFFSMNAEELGLVKEELSVRRGTPQPLKREIPAIWATTQENSRMRILLRRHILLGILAIPFSLMQESAVTDAEAYLTQCQEQISSCWRLLHGKEISAVQFLLCSWLPPLEQLLSRSFPRWRKAAHLAAQGYILTGLVAILQRQNDAAEWCRRQAVEYAELSGDINLKIAALKHLATHYDDLRCFLVTRSVYEEALPLIAEATPLLRSRIELGLALAESRLGQQQKALHYWNVAQEHFPTYPEEEDPAFAYADCGKASFNHYGGLMYLEFGQAEQAWKLFNEVTTLPTPIPQRTTNEIVLCKAQTTLALRDLERTVNHLREGIQGAIELKSEMRLHDSLKLYQRACMLWPSEHVLRELEYLFH